MSINNNFQVVGVERYVWSYYYLPSNAQILPLPLYRHTFMCIMAFTIITNKPEDISKLEIASFISSDREKNIDLSWSPKWEKVNTLDC